MNYQFPKAEALLHSKPKKWKMETNLIPRKLAEHMANGWNGVNV